MPSLFLYEKIESARELGVTKSVPQFIIDNLSKNIKLRDYQLKAFENTLIYLEGNLSKNKQTHILYHMATGSGKTVIMAMDILYYYSLGYRNFIFFTNQTNIVSKTRINFLEKGSGKYLFANSINISGKTIKIKEVQNFEDADPTAINICFNTVQGIHSSLSIIKEGSLSLDDFENEKVVLIADEAHHLNSTTAKDKEENEVNATWEDTVNSIFLANKDNVLLEYTATCDIQDLNVRAKYLDKIIYNFDLKEFRKAGYTKEFANLQSDTTKWTRTLQALIVSEYRKLLFEEHKISIKPVVLLKSRTINDSDAFYSEFYSCLDKIDEAELSSIKENNKGNFIFDNAFNYFGTRGMTLESLAELIKLDFAKDNSVNMNELNPENEKIVNNLDEKDNHYRLIFIVDKLTEGWDVLSLYDIVRLYETRQGGSKGAVSKYTISEAQLIGRGARYCPFAFDKNQIPEKRKYSDYSNPLSICETLLYHCMQEARYIDELKKALKQTGLLPDVDPVRVEYKLKDSFKKSKIYLEGFVFLNERVEVSRDTVHSIPQEIKSAGISYKATGGKAKIGSFLDDSFVEEEEEYKINDPVKFADLPKNIIAKAYRSFFSTLSFAKLKEQFPHLKNEKEFLLSNDYVGDYPITFYIKNGGEINAEDYLGAAKKVLSNISDYVQKIEITFNGTKEFKAYPIREKFTDRIRNVTREKEDESWGNGVSQLDALVDSRYRLDLSDKDWYAYNDNFGTSEEKKFVKYFSTKIAGLRKYFSNIYLIRNEIQVGIYSFGSGKKFEPDYLLILERKEENKKGLYLNIFVEPKGQHLLATDDWKNTLLLDLKNNAVPVVKFVDDNEYKIWGTPLYNESCTRSTFDQYFDESINDSLS